MRGREKPVPNTNTRRKQALSDVPEDCRALAPTETVEPGDRAWAGRAPFPYPYSSEKPIWISTDFLKEPATADLFLCVIRSRAADEIAAEIELL